MLYVIIFAALGAFLSLIGGVILTLQKNSKAIAGYAAAFAAGALLATVAFDLLPHISHEEGDLPFLFILIGILIFFLIELILNHTSKNSDRHLAPLIIVGDTLHNIIDGAVIAAGFLISVPSGIIVTLTVMAHELPQEIGDFGLLLHSGISRKRTIVFNFASAIFTVVAAAVFFALGEQNQISTSLLMGLASGFFLYIAFSVLLEIHHAGDRKIIWKKAGFLFAGLVIVWLIIELLGH